MSIPTRNIYFIHDNGNAELKCGDQIVLLDAEDVDEASKYQWSIGTHGYATSGAGKDQILLHRMLVKASDGFVVDHINRNKLDNRKANLRVCTPKENSFNIAPNVLNSSGYKGVCKTKDGKWQAQIVYNKKAIYLGCYDDAETAAKVYDQAARKLFGKYAYINFPNSSDAESKEINHHFILNKKQVQDIRDLYKSGMTIRQLSDLYHHSYRSINSIVRNKTFINEERS